MRSQLAATPSTSLSANPQGRLRRAHPISEGSSVEQAASTNYGDDRWSNNSSDSTSLLVHRPATNRAASFPGTRQQDNQRNEDEQNESQEEEKEDDQSESEEADSVDERRTEYKFVSSADMLNRSHRQDPSLKCRACFRDRRFCDQVKPRCGVCVEKRSVCAPQDS